MRFLYNLSIHLFRLGVEISATFGNEKAKKWRDGRRGLLKKLKTQIPSDQKLAWFHCASLGEFEQARPLLEQIKKKNDYFILLTFFSPSGYESKKDYELADLVCYMPNDTKKTAKEFIETINPSLTFFAKYEFWFNILNQLQKREKAHFLISGIFRKEQQFFQFYGSWFRKHLAGFTHLYVQDEKTEQLLIDAGIPQVSVSGDGRFDRVKEISESNVSLPLIDQFTSGSETVIFGSSWQKENELAFQLAQKENSLKIIIAPHEYHSSEIDQLSKKYKIEANFYSQLKAGDKMQGNVLIIDKMGLLAKLYRYSDLAVIGGGFGKGIHNILEAAVYGQPILFGPNYRIFNEAWGLLAQGGAKVFKNEKQFHQLFEEVFNDKQKRSKMAENCKQYFYTNTGATQLIYNHLTELNYL